MHPQPITALCHPTGVVTTPTGVPVGYPTIGPGHDRQSCTVCSRSTTLLEAVMAELRIATFNLENLDETDVDERPSLPNASH